MKTLGDWLRSDLSYQHIDVCHSFAQCGSSTATQGWPYLLLLYSHCIIFLWGLLSKINFSPWNSIALRVKYHLFITIKFSQQPFHKLDYITPVITNCKIILMTFHVFTETLSKFSHLWRKRKSWARKYTEYTST